MGKICTKCYKTTPKQLETCNKKLKEFSTFK